MEPASLAGLPNVETVLYAVGRDRESGHSQRAVYVDGLANVLSRLRLPMRDSNPPPPALPANGEGADFPPFAGGLRGGNVAYRPARSIVGTQRGL